MHATSSRSGPTATTKGPGKTGCSRRHGVRRSASVIRRFRRTSARPHCTFARKRGMRGEAERFRLARGTKQNAIRSEDMRHRALVRRP